MKPPALDRRVLEQAPSLGLELVDARREHRLDARGQLALVILHADGDELLDEQRVALSALRDPRGLHPPLRSRWRELARLRDIERVES